MSAEFYVVECRAVGCDVAVYLNDVRVGNCGESHGRFLAGPFNELMVDGVNTLGMRIDAMSPPLRVAHAYVKITRYPFGAFAGAEGGTELLRLEWKTPAYPKVDSVECGNPGWVSCSADLGDMFGAWVWETAPQLTLDEEKFASILALLEELRGSLAAGNPEPFIQLSEMRTGEMHRAYDLDLSEDLQSFREDVKQGSQWGVEPIVANDFTPALCAGERMVECVAADSKAALRSQPNGEGHRTYYKLFLCEIEGKWRIVR